MMNFKDKVVLVTGSGSGIGRRTAMMFAELGAKVAVNDVSIENGEDTVRQILANGGEAFFVPGDVATDAKTIIEKVVEKFGKIDILVNNAGIVPYGNIEEATEQDYIKTFDINVKGPFLLSKYAVEYMKNQKYGVIVNVSSEAGLVGIKRRCVYSMSKAALLGLTRSLAIDYAEYGIRVNAICPGTTYSKGLSDRINAAPNPQELLNNMISRIPVKRLGKEEEIAFGILFLASDEASFMTGAFLNMDGGSTAI